MLDKELETFNRNLNSLLGLHRGKFVLIHGDQIAGVFNSREDAVNCGHREFGITPFLVKRISEFEEVLNFTSNLIICEKGNNNAVVHSTHT